MSVNAQFLGSARLQRAGERVLAFADFSLTFVAREASPPKETLFRRDAETSTRDACATQIR
jgi:hypothetical protein